MSNENNEKSKKNGDKKITRTVSKVYLRQVIREKLGCRVEPQVLDDLAKSLDSYLRNLLTLAEQALGTTRRKTLTSAVLDLAQNYFKGAGLC